MTCRQSFAASATAWNANRLTEGGGRRRLAQLVAHFESSIHATTYLGAISVAQCLPMLFLAGTRDRLAAPELLRPLCARLGGRATLCEIPDADHGFHVPKRSGRSDQDVLDELATTVRDWTGNVG